MCRLIGKSSCNCVWLIGGGRTCELKLKLTFYVHQTTFVLQKSLIVGPRRRVALSTHHSLLILRVLKGFIDFLIKYGARSVERSCLLSFRFESIINCKNPQSDTNTTRSQLEFCVLRCLSSSQSVCGCFIKLPLETNKFNYHLWISLIYYVNITHLLLIRPLLILLPLPLSLSILAFHFYLIWKICM